MEKLIYFDNAATTKIYPEVLKEMLPYFSKIYSNPSGIYEFSAKARKATDLSRERIAKLINADTEEIYFTSGGTESDNWALKSAAQFLKGKGNHIITSKIEHPAVINTCRYLEKNGYEVTYLDVDSDGIVNPEHVMDSVKKGTIIISIMFANNEVGSIQPIKQIGRIAKENNILFHTDAVQAFGQIPIDVKDLNIDMLSASAHKLHGPKGIGCLYINKNINIDSFMHGGSQEKKLRAGTLNVPGIVGFGKAAEMAAEKMEEKIGYEIKLRDYLIDSIIKNVPYTKLNGSDTNRLPNNTNFSFKFIEGESLLIILDTLGICASTGSACSAGSKAPSHVLMAMGKTEDEAHGSLRLTLSGNTTIEEVDYVVKSITESVESLRKMSTEYSEFKTM